MSTPFDSQAMSFSQEEYQYLLALICPQPFEISSVNYQDATIFISHNVLPNSSEKFFISTLIFPSCHSNISCYKNQPLQTSLSTWIIDTRATNYIIHSINLCSTVTKVLNTYVKLPNGEHLTVTQIETIHLSDNLIYRICHTIMCSQICL